jgi:hypothetical protein
MAIAIAVAACAALSISSRVGGRSMSPLSSVLFAAVAIGLSRFSHQIYAMRAVSQVK